MIKNYNLKKANILLSKYYIFVKIYGEKLKPARKMVNNMIAIQLT